MNILDGTCSWITQCNHIGEAKLFGYILATFNQTDATWTNTDLKQKAVEKLYGIKKATMFNYLKSLCKNKLLIRESKGQYRVNAEYVSFGKLVKIDSTNGVSDSK